MQDKDHYETAPFHCDAWKRGRGMRDDRPGAAAANETDRRARHRQRRRAIVQQRASRRSERVRSYRGAKLRSGAPIGGRTAQPLAGTRSRAGRAQGRRPRGPVHALRLGSKQATREIPIVILSGDPLGTGLVESLSRPGANITGLSQMGAETLGKCVELSRDLLPSARRVAVIANAADPAPAREAKSVPSGWSMPRTNSKQPLPR